MIKEKQVVVNSSGSDFKRLVLEYGRMKVGRKVTYRTFEKWLEINGYRLLQSDTNWRAIFHSLLTHRFSTVTSYCKDKDSNLITVFELN